MPNNVDIISLPRTPRNALRFLNASYPIYAGDPNWVAPLLSDVKKVLLDGNPLFGHAKMALWVAVRGGRDIGRIAAVLDENYTKGQNDNAAFFGFFECVNEPAVSRLLFEAAFAWARREGARRILGPMNPTSNDECGLLIDGFDSPPVFMMTYNPPYYVDLVEAEGFRKAKDLLAYRLDVLKASVERVERIGQKTRRRHPELSFVPVRKATLARDLAKIKEVYNAAWESNWGFVAMTDEEIDFMADRLKPLLVDDLIWVAETPTEPVGFMLAMPDYNVALQPLRGHLLTPRLLGFIPYVLGWKHPKWCRVLTLGVKEKYRNKGIEAVMLAEGFKTGLKLGFTHAEGSWILEDNVMMRRVLEGFQGKVYKTYRLYDRDLQP